MLSAWEGNRRSVAATSLRQKLSDTPAYSSRPLKKETNTSPVRLFGNMASLLLS